MVERLHKFWNGRHKRWNNVTNAGTAPQTLEQRHKRWNSATKARVTRTAAGISSQMPERRRKSQVGTITPQIGGLREAVLLFLFRLPIIGAGISSQTSERRRKSQVGTITIQIGGLREAVLLF